MRRPGIAMIGTVAARGAVFPWLFDANASHMFNPDWTPHARLHDAIAVIGATLTGGIAVALLCQHAVRRRPDLLGLVTLLSASPWLAILLAGLVPGTSYGNPALGTETFVVFGVRTAAPAVASIVFCALATVGLVLAIHRHVQLGAKP